MALNEFSPATEVSAEKYKEEGFFKRFGKMLNGFSRPADSREYKEALIELQRLSAPITAVLVPAIAVIVLIVVSAVNDKKAVPIEIDIADIQQEEDKLEEIKPPEEVEPPETEVDPTITTDVPNVATPQEMSDAVVSNEPVTPKVNNVDAMMNIKSPVTLKSVFGSSRSTGVRGQYTRGGAAYGDQVTEAAVLKALRWLKHTQKSDGRWDGFPSNSAFAVLSYLAHGETPGSKEFGYTVERALDYLKNSVETKREQKADGEHLIATRIRGTDGNEYCFPIVTYALSEAYGMTQNPDIKEVAEACLQRLVDTQSSTGGWDYKLNKNSNRDDTSLGGWCIQALKAGKMAGLHPEGLEDCITKAVSCLKSRAFDDGCAFRYNGDKPGGSRGLGGVGCLAMQLLGYGKEPEVRKALTVMQDWLPSFDKNANDHFKSGCPQYYCYYAAQCKYQAGMVKGAAGADFTLWKRWNQEMKKLYPPSIVTLPEKIEGPDGKMHEMGYWQNNDAHGNGLTMSTCLTALQLMVYYRYLPTTRIANQDVEADINAAAKDKDGEVGVTIDI